MPKINKPSGLSKLWANLGAKTAPDDSKISLGWVVEPPPHQIENWLQNRNDTAVGHINQAGVPEWSADVEYIGNFSWTLGSNGYLYACRVTNTGNNPVLDVGETYWKLILDRNSLLRTLETTTYTRNLLTSANEAALFSNLNITSLGKTIIQSAAAPSIRTALGATTIGNNLFTAATQLDARNAIGVGSANDTTEGLSARATDSEVIAGVEDTKFLTSRKLKLGFGISLNPTGFLNFPSWMGGLMVKWGTFTSSTDGNVAVTFPSAFPNSCFGVTSFGQTSSQSTNVPWSANSITRFGFNSNRDGGVDGFQTFIYFAIGY